MKLESPAFEHGGRIPAEYTCDGEDKIPELRIKDAPENAKSFALICEDPDAPRGTWDHWIAWNIPITDKITSLVGVKGKNSWGRLDYGGRARLQARTGITSEYTPWIRSWILQREAARKS